MRLENAQHSTLNAQGSRHGNFEGDAKFDLEERIFVARIKTAIARQGSRRGKSAPAP